MKVENKNTTTRVIMVCHFVKVVVIFLMIIKESRLQNTDRYVKPYELFFFLLFLIKNYKYDNILFKSFIGFDTLTND